MFGGIGSIVVVVISHCGHWASHCGHWFGWF